MDRFCLGDMLLGRSLDLDLFSQLDLVLDLSLELDLVLVSLLFLSLEPLLFLLSDLDRSLDLDLRVVVDSLALAGSSSYFWTDGTRLWNRIG